MISMALFTSLRSVRIAWTRSKTFSKSTRMSPRVSLRSIKRSAGSVCLFGTTCRGFRSAPKRPSANGVVSHPIMSIYDELQWRGLIADCTDPENLKARLSAGPITLYCGFDPTSDSLHVGNLVPLLALRRFQLAGHHPIALAGGATGMIGDPAGKSDERARLSPDQLEQHLACLQPQLARFLDFSTTS